MLVSNLKYSGYFSVNPRFKKGYRGTKKRLTNYLTDESSLVAGTGISSIAFRMDVIGGLTRKSSDRFAFHLFTFPSAFESKLSALPEMQKASQILTGFS
jgi:hypothetical protein